MLNNWIKKVMNRRTTDGIGALSISGEPRNSGLTQANFSRLEAFAEA